MQKDSRNSCLKHLRSLYEFGYRPEKIVLIAHLDTVAGTLGAFDNTSGIAVLAALAETIGHKDRLVGLQRYPVL